MESLGPLSPAEWEDCHERAAIAEFDGDLPQPIAESEARRMIGALRWRAQNR